MNAEHKGTVAFALCGSFCTFEAAVPQAARLAAMGWQVLPIMSFAAVGHRHPLWAGGRVESPAGTCGGASGAGHPGRGGAAGPPADGGRAGHRALHRRDPGPAGRGTVGYAGGRWRPRACCGRAGRWNRYTYSDGLGASGENIARLMQRKHFYFVPFGQDDPVHKPQSLKADLTLVPGALAAALEERQIQPVLLQSPLSPP